MKNYEYLNAYSITCGFLASFFLKAPNEGFLCLVRDEGLLGIWPEGADMSELQEGLALVRASLTEAPEGEPERIARDYTELFIGPESPLPMWESVWTGRERLLYGEPTFQVREFYFRHGLEAPRKDNEPDDHLSLELAFVATLLGRAYGAAKEGREGQVKNLCSEVLTFYHEHIEKWAFECLNLIEGRAATRLIKHIVMLTRKTLEDLPRAIDDLEVY